MQDTIAVTTLMTLHHGPGPHPFPAGAEILLPRAEAVRLMEAGLVTATAAKPASAPAAPAAAG